MSIIIGIATEVGIVVASDGRETEGTSPVIPVATIKNDKFDKTFKFDENKIIGCMAGTTQFQGKIIRDHLSEIIKQYCQTDDSLQNILRNLKAQMKIRIESIPNTEISFHHRKIDMILIGSSSSKLKGSKIYTFSFKPNLVTHEIVVGEEVFPASKKNELPMWKIYGDPSAQDAVKKYLKTSFQKPREINLDFLRSVAKTAITVGINKSGIHPHGKDNSCGGDTFIQSYDQKYI